MQLRVKVCCAGLALICSHVSLCAAIRPKALTLLITCLKKEKLNQTMYLYNSCWSLSQGDFSVLHLRNDGKVDF